MSDWALEEVANAIEGDVCLGSMPPIGALDTPLGRVVIDSRQVQPGDVFWALPGNVYDGGMFVDEAFARGAGGVVVAGRHVEPWAGCWSISVPDAQQALWRYAAEVRKRFAGTVVAVTGSVGKTSTRSTIGCVLSGKYQGTAGRENYNNHIGVPLSMVAWHPLDDYAVLELGASAAGEIEQLSRLCQPDVGVITCIGEAHLAGFGSQEALAAAKGELLNSLPPLGHAVLNADDTWLQKLSARSGAPVCWYGRSPEADVTARDVAWDEGWLRFTVDRQRFAVPVWGRHFLTSALAAISVGRLLGIGDAHIAARLRNYEPAVRQRCEVQDIGGVRVIDDAYNASPKAMTAALELLREMPTEGRRIVVCGDMAQLGAESRRWHAQLGQEVVSVCGADLLIACGRHASDVTGAAMAAGMPARQVHACASVEQAAEEITKLVLPGDAMLVKGSRTMKMEQIVERLTAVSHARAA